MRNNLVFSFPSLTKLLALEFGDSRVCKGTSMVSKGYSISLEKKIILPHMRKVYEYDKTLLTLLHALAKLWKF